MRDNCFTATPVIRGKHVFAFISPQGAGPMSCPLLDGCILTGGVDVTSDAQLVKQKCPSIVDRNKFDIVSTFTARKDIETRTSLSARLPADMRSLFLKLTKAGCSFDMVWASGVCSDPNDLNQFDRLEVFEGVFVGSYGHDAVGTFDDSEVGEDVLETVELTVTKYFDFARPEVVNTITLGGGSFTDVVYCPASCTDTDDCTINNVDGCSFPFATAIFSGSPSQLNVYYSYDGGQTLTFTPVDTGDFTDASVMCFAGYTVIGHNGTGSDYYYARQAAVLDGSAVFVPVGSGTGLKTGATDGNALYMLGNGVYKLSRSTIASGVTPVINTGGVAMNDMDHYGGRFVAVGDSGQIELIRSGVATTILSPTASDIVSVNMIGMSTWWIGTDSGDLYWTDTGGDSWASVGNVGANPGIMFASKYIGYISSDDGIFLTVDGGCSWDSIYSGGTFCGIDLCDNGNRFIACRGGALVVGTDDLALCLFPVLDLVDPCTAAGVVSSFTADFVCGVNPGELIIELRTTSFTGTTTVTGYAYEFLSGPIVGSYPTGSGDLDLVVSIPGATDDVYQIRLDINIVECGIASSIAETLTIPCSIVVCGGECIVCGGDMLIQGGCACA